MLADISLFTISLFIHVSAAIVGLGATFALAVGFPLALKLDARHLPYVHELSLRVTQRLGSPGLLILLVTGIYQASHLDVWSKPWLSISLVLVIVLGAMQGAYFMRTDRKLAAMASAELAGGATTLSADYQRQAQREGGIGALAGLLILVIVFLMVTQPGG